MSRFVAAAALIVAALVVEPNGRAIAAAQSDLDAFMQQVLARRDDNWKKLQQYILDEREQIEVRGPARVSLWGERREYMWYIRDGFFVRSPLKVNGVTIGETERRKYEADYLRRMQRREQRNDQNRADLARPAPGAGTSVAQTTETEAAPIEAPSDVAGLVRQSRQPEFISSAYFLRFKFDEGTYALVGKERLENRDVLRIEYYPTKLFTGREGQEGQARRERRERDNQQDAQFNRLMNKVALITLWIEPSSHQIVKYTYDNVALDFLPGQWLVHVDDISASMTMSQPFPDVWLPQNLQMKAGLTFALGQVEFRAVLDYYDYRQADATVKIR